MAPAGDVTYIDVGAYNGDSIELVRQYYGKRLKKCIAFEPDKNLFNELKKYVSDSGINNMAEIYPYALGDEEKAVSFASNGLVGEIRERGDSMVYQKIFDNLPIQTIGKAMIKMDIEGYELKALKGMKNFIKDNEPYLAICIYHKEKDLYEIAKYIKNLNPDFKLYIRGGWHLECWAVPKTHFMG